MIKGSPVEDITTLSYADHDYSDLTQKKSEYEQLSGLHERCACYEGTRGLERFLGSDSTGDATANRINRIQTYHKKDIHVDVIL